MLNDYRGKAVLITGGTKGIGLACGLAFGRQGAQLYLTHRWGSADEGEIQKQFESVGAPAPLILEADASQSKDTKALMERIAKDHDGIEAFISNVCVVSKGEGTDELNKRSLLRSLEYSSWPFVEYLHRMKDQFGRYPSYAVAMSSDGPDNHFPGYDYVALAKGVLETFVRYMSTHLREEGVKVNALRTRQVITDSYREIFGDELVNLSQQFPEYLISAEEVADTTLALCSGLMDSMSGQVVTLDRGASFVDNVYTMGKRVMESAQKG